jgi:prepilin-type N-terminal cleavage/methylation domain-containing protein
MPRQDPKSRQQGFSLVELMIAMVVTLIITGAVFKLVTAGQTAFRREPALADRQQNIRVAMDVISQDLYKAGSGLPQFAQAFTDGLDAVGSQGSMGADTDELEIFSATECPPLTVCPVSGQAGKSVTTRELMSACYSFPALVILGDDETWALRWAKKPGAGSTGSCDGAPPGVKGGHAVFPPGQAPLVNPTGGFSGWQPNYMLVGQAIRYRINIDAEGTPNLERSAFGGQDDLDGNSTWQIVARGVEDLQVQYLNGAGWQDEPGTISCGVNCSAPTPADYDTIIRRVRVRLSARAMEVNLQGQSTSAVGNAVRGQLVTEIAPRPAATTLGQQKGEV